VPAKQFGHFGFANQAAECWRGEFFLRDFPAVVSQIVPKCAQLKTGFNVYLKTLEEILYRIAIILARCADIKRRTIGNQVVTLPEDIVLYRKTVLFFFVFCLFHNLFLL
jgi:hypothetical protein